MSEALNYNAPVTYADYLTWPDDQRWEIIDGVPYAMAAPGFAHQAVLGNLHNLLSAHFKKTSCAVVLAPFDVLLDDADVPDDQVEFVVQPDISVFCDRSKTREKNARGAPSLVVEILSPSTAGRDLYEKMELYERFGVAEYWVVDPGNQWIAVYTLGADGKFAPPRTFNRLDKLTSAAWPALSFAMSDVFPASA